MVPLRRAACGLALCATAVHAQVATAVGVVVDSLRGRPLVGATIVVAGAESQGVSDSSGRFRIDSIPPGEHAMAVIHPWLDSIGISLATNKIAFAAGTVTQVVLATPSAQSWIGRRCADADRQNGAAAIIGHVLQLTTDDPVAGALVRYTTTTFVAGRDVGFHHTTVTRDATVTLDGEFIVCGLPAGSGGTIRASRGRVSTGDVPASLADQSLIAVTLRLPSDSLAERTSFASGKVVDESGAPVPAATIVLRGGQQHTQTSDSGTFSLRDLPLGSQVVEANKVGFLPIGVVVTLLPNGTTVAGITLAHQPASAADAGLVSVGFVRRRAGGVGTFLTAADIAKRKARYLADMQPQMPDLMMISTSDGPYLMPTRAATGSQCLFYLVDRALYRWIGPRRFNDEYPAGSIAGIEYYQYGHIPRELFDKITDSTPVPVQVSPRKPPVIANRNCSLLVIWTNATAQGGQ